ncbi:hypothetical protein [Algisphaera agarilytica]|uniref:Uncharacterized protein n=1 Tax=Algisphaera agarilytica TaxID=1385975 RepID=A0A7X0H5W9_9BACT|nr:hypothetical protein [Algisphaera agarilytica]MBB6429637.1 hypothetical protein [Algisphaera agarilytica]
MNSSADKPSHLSDPTALVELFNLGQAESPLPWNTNDLAAILRHQLHQPLGPLPDKVEDGLATRPHLELFTQTSPPLDRLRRVKDQAKAGSNQDDELPRDVATVMYYAALAAARLHHPDESITRLDDEAFRVGLDWALQLPWLDPALKPLFSQAYDSAQGEAT